MAEREFALDMVVSDTRIKAFITSTMYDDMTRIAAKGIIILLVRKHDIK